MSASTTGSPMTSEVEAAEHAWLEIWTVTSLHTSSRIFLAKLISTFSSVHTFADDTFLSSSFSFSQMN